MAIPRVFISSTCYDLKYIRENLKFFVKTIGYEPVLSEDGDVFYNPKLHTHDSCVTEIETCQLFVLIIGGRYGGQFKDSDKSITNKEFESAIKLKVPIFALVESGVYGEHHLFVKNRTNKSIDYPSVDNINIFDFIDQVRKNVINNAVVSFNDFSDIEAYLKKQWAGMMYYYLTSETESNKVSDLLTNISSATQKIEYFTKQIATSSADKETLIDIDLYDSIVGEGVVSTISGWGYKVNPVLILKWKTIDEFCNGKIEISDEDHNIIYSSSDGKCKLSQTAYDQTSKRYKSLRDKLIDIIENKDLTVKEYLEEKQK